MWLFVADLTFEEDVPCLDLECKEKISPRMSYHCSSFLSNGWDSKDTVKCPIHIWMDLGKKKKGT